MTEKVRSKELLEALAAPFKPEDIEWRVQSATNKNGVIKLLVLPYIESREVMNRLDAVCGANWQTHYDKIQITQKKELKEAFQCRLSIKIDEEWITRTDAAEISDIESVKGGHSNALKRAAVQWGVGRYLYDCPQYWVELKQRGEHRVWGNFKINGQIQQLQGYFDTPQLPEWALPAGYEQPSSQQSQSQKPSTNQEPNQNKQNKQSSRPSNSEIGSPKHQEALGLVKGLLNSLNVPLKFVPGLLERIGYQGDLDQAPIATLKSIYKILFPVDAYVTECTKLKLSTNQILDYAQITLKVPLDNYLNMLFKMDIPLAQETLDLVKADLQIAS